MLGHLRATLTRRDDDLFVGQSLVGGFDRAPGHSELGGQGDPRGKPCARRERAAADRGEDVAADLLRQRDPGGPIDPDVHRGGHTSWYIGKYHSSRLQNSPLRPNFSPAEVAKKVERVPPLKA